MEDTLYDDLNMSNDEDDIEGKCLQKRTKLKSIIFLITTSIGFGTVWRFTYVMHKNGGAIFIVPYFIMMFLIGLPLCCLDAHLGWCSKLGAVRVWQLTKISAGIGFALSGISFIVSTYTGVIISWTFFYFFSSFRRYLPWTCQGNKTLVSNGICGNEIINRTDLDTNWTSTVDRNKISLSENFFMQRVVNFQPDLTLQSFSNFKYSLVICLAFTWICTWIIVTRGFRASQKTAFLGTILVILMLCLTVGSSIKESGYINIKRSFSENWSELLSVEPWLDAAAQILFSLGPGYGFLITIANNKCYNSNFFTDCYLIVILQSVFSFLLTCAIVIATGSQTTSIYRSGTQYDNNQSDIGYIFILFAAQLARLPGGCLWCGIFFLGMALMGLTTIACHAHTIYQWILTINCRCFCQYKKCFIGIILGFSLFFFGILLTSSGGYLLLRALDQRITELAAASVAIFECLIIGWLYGGKKFLAKIETITDEKSRIPWNVMWEFVTPVIIATLLLSNLVDDEEGTVTTYYTIFVLGRLIADLPLLWIPLYACALLVATCFNPNKKFAQLFTTSHTTWIPASSRVDKTNNCSLSKLNKRHFSESEPILMVRVEDPAYGDIPHGFFYNPNQKNIIEILQNLSSKSEFDLADKVSKEPNVHQTQYKNGVPKSPRGRSNFTISMDYTSLSNVGSTPVLVAKKIPFPASLTLANFPSLVVLPPQDIWPSPNELPNFNSQIISSSSFKLD